MTSNARPRLAKRFRSHALRRASTFLLSACFMAMPIVTGCASAPVGKCVTADTVQAGQAAPPSGHGAEGTEGDTEAAMSPGHHNPLVHRFDNAKDWTKRFEGPKRDAAQKPSEVVAAMALHAGARVADIGAGTGYFLPYLSKAVGPDGVVIAADIEPGMVRHIKNRAAREALNNVQPRLVLGDDPLLSDGSLDNIIIVNTWHHIPARLAYANKLMKALKDGGSVWVIDFKMDAPHGPAKSHRLLPAQVTKELTDAGLSVRIDENMLRDQYIAIGTKKATSTAAAGKP